MDANARELLAEYLAEIGGDVGENLVFDEDGDCLIETEHGVECVISVREAGLTFLLSSDLAEVQPGEDPAFFRALLELNSDFELLCGGALSLDPGTGGIVLSRLHGITGLTQEGFEAVIADFLTVAAAVAAEVYARRSGSHEAGAVAALSPDIIRA